MKTVQYLGIDFGSSTTSIVGFLKEGVEKPILFGRVDSDYQFKSVILKGNATTHFFQEVYTELDARLRRAKGEGKGIEAVDLGELCDDLKERLVNEKSSAAEKNAYIFLKKVAEVIKEMATIEGEKYDFSNLEGVVFGHPAYYEANAIDYYCDAMKKIVEKVLRETFNISAETQREMKIVGVAEPVLAACAYGYAYGDNKFEGGETILVLDFGGHTLDVALMKALKKGDEIQLIKEKNCVSFNEAVQMGKQITQELCQQVYRGRAMENIPIPFDWGVDDAKCALFTGKSVVEKDSQFLDRVHGKDVPKHYCLKYDARDEKMAGTISFVGRGPGKICIEEKFARIVEFIRVYLASVSEELDEKRKKISINYVLFTGGTAKMKPLRKYVREQLSDWFVNNSPELLMDEENVAKEIFQAPKLGLEKISLSSKNAVALGAALVAAGKCNPILTVKEKSSEDLKEAQKKNERLEQKQKELEMQLDIERLKLGAISETRRKSLLKKLEAEQVVLFKKALTQAVEKRKDLEALVGLSDEEKKILCDILNKLKIIG